MFTYQITTRNTQYDIENSSDKWVLADGQTITANSQHGIYETAQWHENEIVVNGDISTTGNYKAGVYTAGTQTSVTIGTTGSITGYYGVDVTGNDAHIVNRGLIDTTGAGIVVSGNDATKATIANYGTIETDNYCASFHPVESGKIVNHGHLGGTAGIAADGAKVTVVLGKDSVIDVDGSGIDITSDAGQKAHIVNQGSITSGSWAFYGRDGSETFINRGTMSGGIALGEGNDLFDNRGGTVDDRISGDEGNDVFIIDSKVEIGESQGDGTDTVKSLVSTSFSSNLLKGYELENLTLLGSKNIDATGNELGNHLKGNLGNNLLNGLAGDDVLTGGKGADMFVFKTGFGADTVTDFGNGGDRIDLSDLNGVTNFSDLMQHHVKVSGDDLLIQAGSDTLTLLNTEKFDLDASDFLF
jgi:Ca2+-binding RTX toxin-like protein